MHVKEGTAGTRMTGSMAMLCAAALLLSFSVRSALAGEGSGGAAPRISVAEPVHDFGAVQAGTVLEHVFEIRNAGQGVLEIRKVEPS
jgi:hypothetical protein